MSQTNKRSPIAITIYAWVISLALILHVFNEMTLGELKLFHIPTTLAFLISTAFIYKLCKPQVYAYCLIIFTFISAILSVYPQALYNALIFMVVIGACGSIPKCSYDHIIKLTNYLIPIPMAFLAIGLAANEKYRYTGMYNDPNYLCTTMLVFLFIICQGFYIFKNRTIKIGLICEILIILAITAATLSRTGLACILLMVIISSWVFIKKYKVIAVALLIGGIGYLCYDTPPVVVEAIDKFESREENKGNFSSASNLRYEISMRGIRYVLSNPIELPFGMGIGAVGHWEYFNSDNTDIHIDHNTLTASFSEQGIIGLIFFVLILYTTFKTNWDLPPNSKLRLLRLSAFFSIFIFSLSINQMTYLPFWWLIFLLNNTTSLHEDSSYRRLRSFRKH